MKKKLEIIAAPLPFSNKQTHFQIDQGATILDIVCETLPDHIHIDDVGAVVFVGGEIVPREYWPSVRPKQGHLINVRVIPLGGGGGKKNPLATILSLVVAFAAPYLATALIGTTLFATAATAALAHSALTAAIGVVGRLLITAIAPPPKQSNAGTKQLSAAASSPTQFIEGARNQIAPYGIVPICLGTNRMFPFQAARPFTESRNDSQYVRQLFTYGYGEKLILSDFKIGESDLANFTDFEMEHRLEGDLHEGTNLYSSDVYQEDFSILLSQPDGFTVRTTQVDVDESIIDITFPQGMIVYEEDGSRHGQTIEFEAQFALAGESPQQWSPGSTAYTEINGGSLGINPVVYGGAIGLDYTNQPETMHRTDIVALERYGTRYRVFEGEHLNPETAPLIPENYIALASVYVTTMRDVDTGILTSDIAVTDTRQPSLFGARFQNSTDFMPSKASESTVDIADGFLKDDVLKITAAQSEAFRKTVRFVFPTRGQYDIRVRRVSGDSNQEAVRDDGYLTAIKSITYRSPVVLEGQNGTAIVIRATDQLNGALDQFNVVVSNIIPDYDSTLGAWVDRATSNPAALYRYVLQCGANARALSDDRLIIEDFEDWHVHCTQQNYTYNRVIDYETSLDDVLRDIAAAGSASPAIVDGKRTIVIDRVKPQITQIITPRNSWDYSAEMVYFDHPHALRMQFRNPERGYGQDERIAYDDGYDKDNATQYESMEVMSITNADLAYKTGRRHLADAKLRPETHTWMMDIENLVSLRGDRIILIHDIPLVGVGDARLKSVTLSGDSPALVTGITFDDTVVIPAAGTYYVRCRKKDGTLLYEQINASVGAHKSFTMTVPFPVSEAPEKGDLCGFMEAGGELDLIISKIHPAGDLTARIVAVNYAPEIFTAESSAIPAFDSKITTPLEFIRPEPPVLIKEQSNEDVMLRNSDGSFTPRAIFTLQNNNVGDIFTSVKIRRSGTSIFKNADVLEATPDRLVLTGMDDGKRYDVHIRYKRAGASMMSRALELNSYLFIGASGTPDNVSGFTISVVDNMALLKWTSNDDIDLSHYIVKFAPIYFGATWATAQLLESKVYENRLSTPFIGGTYLIKAVDLTGNESDEATAIITYNPGALGNAVATMTESPDFDGDKDNTAEVGGMLILSDTELSVGYYYFADILDLNGLYSSYISAQITAGGVFLNDLFDMGDIFAESDIMAGFVNDIFDFDDLFSVDDVFGIGLDSWAVELQYSTIAEDPNDSPAIWSDWMSLNTGSIEFWAVKFRLKLISYQVNISPQVTGLVVNIDMPDRIVRGDDLTVLAAGASVTFAPEFQASPSVVITIQDGATDDRIEFISKTAGEFTFKVYNETAAAYVERTFDYIASGYGRKQT